MVGMGAMVGGGTGAVMTAVTMIFEMTRDYDIVLPMIVAVALSVGVRRLLSRENIYTLKLVRRGHVIPKALHANMFLVRRAREVMDTDVVLAPAEMTFDAFLAQPDHAGRMRHVVVIEGNRILGVLRVNTALRHASEGAHSSVTLRDIASRDFTVVREDDIVFDVIRRMLAQAGDDGACRARPRRAAAGERRRRDHQRARRRFRRHQHQRLSGMGLNGGPRAGVEAGEGDATKPFHPIARQCLWRSPRSNV